MRKIKRVIHKDPKQIHMKGKLIRELRSWLHLSLIDLYCTSGVCFYYGELWLILDSECWLIADRIDLEYLITPLTGYLIKTITVSLSFSIHLNINQPWTSLWLTQYPINVWHKHLCIVLFYVGLSSVRMFGIDWKPSTSMSIQVAATYICICMYS